MLTSFVLAQRFANALELLVLGWIPDLICCNTNALRVPNLAGQDKEGLKSLYAIETRLSVKKSKFLERYYQTKNMENFQRFASIYFIAGSWLDVHLGGLFQKLTWSVKTNSLYFHTIVLIFAGKI